MQLKRTVLETPVWQLLDATTLNRSGRIWLMFTQTPQNGSRSQVLDSWMAQVFIMNSQEVELQVVQDQILAVSMKSITKSPQPLNALGSAGTRRGPQVQMLTAAGTTSGARLLMCASTK